MQSSSEQPLVGEEHCVTTRITAAKETTMIAAQGNYLIQTLQVVWVTRRKASLSSVCFKFSSFGRSA